MTRSGWIAVVPACAVFGAILAGALGAAKDAPDRTKAAKLMRDGNWKEALDQFQALALDPKDEADKVGEDLTSAVACLANLGRQKEMDEFAEKVIAAHGGNWRLLEAAALVYFQAPHYGTIVAGEFERGQHRGDGRYVNSYERDRARALQLMEQALAPAGADRKAAAAAGCYSNLSHILIGQRGYGEAWRLQYRTDLAALPDYDEPAYAWGGESARGAPVGPDGQPVYHRMPESWHQAASDGERWRWALAEAAEDGADAWARFELAAFLHRQFGVQTLAEYRWFFGREAESDEGRKDESGTWALHTLGEQETIAKLATGIKRFQLPDEFN